MRDGGEYIVNGSKTFITNGINADLVITAVQDRPRERHRGMSLLVLERGMPGFERGRNLQKIGMHAQDTAELSFSDVRVPLANLLGEEDRGFFQLVTKLPQERMSIAIGGVAAGSCGVREHASTTSRNVTRSGGRSVVPDTRDSSSPRSPPRSTSPRPSSTDASTTLNAGELSAQDAAKAKWWCDGAAGPGRRPMPAAPSADTATCSSTRRPGVTPTPA